MQILKIQYNSFHYFLTHTFYYNFIYFIPFPSRHAITNPSRKFPLHDAYYSYPPSASLSISRCISLYHSTRCRSFTNSPASFSLVRTLSPTLVRRTHLFPWFALCRELLTRTCSLTSSLYQLSSFEEIPRNASVRLAHHAA